jgi:hypothetical protein
VVQRLLLDWIDAEAARAPVRRQHDLLALASADEAQAALAVAQRAPARADVALQPTILDAVPVPRGDDPHGDRALA